MLGSYDASTLQRYKASTLRRYSGVWSAVVYGGVWSVVVYGGVCSVVTAEHRYDAMMLRRFDAPTL